MPSVAIKSSLRLIIVLLLGAGVSGAPSSAGESADSKVAPVGSKTHGLSYAEWSARQWQWTYSLPVDAHPLFDTADCSAGQTGNVWFLGGTYSSVEIGPGVVLGAADRTCTIPSGTALFFPLVDVEASTIEGNGESEEELRGFANFFADFIDPSSLFLEIDGKAVGGLESLRVESPPFTFGPLPENNVLQAFGYDAPAGSTSPSVSDGYFAMVKPLPVGTHTLRFGGVLDLSSEEGPTFIQDIEYTITVVPRGRK